MGLAPLHLMEFDGFLDQLCGNVILRQEIKTAVRAVFQERTFGRGTYLVEAGETNRKIFYIASGLVRSFKVRLRQGQEEEINTCFFFDGELTGSLYHSLSSVPIDWYLQTLEPSQLWVTNASLLKDVFKRYPQLYELTSDLDNQLFTKCNAIPDMLRLPTAMERYQFMLQHFPQLKRIKQKDIASFLGVGEQRLSKILNS